MPERILIIDSGFISGEGHHLGVNGMLGAAVIKMGHEAILVVNSASLHSSIVYEEVIIPVAPLLPRSLYHAPPSRTLDDLIKYNDDAYQQLVDLPGDLFADPVRVLVHTTNETQVLGLARWLSEQVGGSAPKVTSAVVTLMMPPPIVRKENGMEEVEPATCEIYRRALHSMSSVAGIDIFGVGQTIAEDHSEVSGVEVQTGGALIGGIGRKIGMKSHSDVPVVLLYIGDAKLDKGLHMLPDIVTRLRATPVLAKFVIHISGSMVGTYSWIVDRIVASMGSDERFELRYGRLTEQEYYNLWDESDAVVLCYHPGVYERKTSGICWDAMNRGVPAIAVAGTWHTLELSRYDYPAIISPAFLAEPLVRAIIAAISQLPTLAKAAVAGRERFLAANDSKIYITRLLN